ncbi:MAG: CBS domain-containing protein [Fervidicoccaceae archaeon]|jgi:CBS domain-containing protein|uniref:CBS domain-containing protein n=1 Tax=Fervidicoccus fontis TaxID=683846 RepID=A0A7C1E193_9CREN
MSRGEYLLIRDIMVTDVKYVSPETPLSTVINIMIQNKIGSVVVVGDKREVLGIITERDLIEKVLAKNLDVRTLRAKDIMSKPVIVVSPDTSVSAAANLMKEKNIGHLPVVENGRLVGIVAEGDVISLAPEFLELLRIRKR